MAIKKSELYSSLGASCDELRGGMDASQYKDYVLFMLSYKYISDAFAERYDQLVAEQDLGADSRGIRTNTPLKVFSGCPKSVLVCTQSQGFSGIGRTDT